MIQNGAVPTLGFASGIHPNLVSQDRKLVGNEADRWTAAPSNDSPGPGCWFVGGPAVLDQRSGDSIAPSTISATR
jgi:hypothetical protein